MVKVLLSCILYYETTELWIWQLANISYSKTYTNVSNMQGILLFYI